MIIHKLSLNNFGLFRGRQTLPLTPNGTGPVILIGGMNGAGKTTLLEAVRLCLYGRRALGNRVSQSEYHDYLFKMIHRNPHSAVPLNYAAVSLEFEYTRGGEKKRYRVERSWEHHGGKHPAVREGLTFHENDWPSPEIEEGHWQDYINELIPIGVSQFFFFDGEDIQKLADDSTHNGSLAESIKALLGLNLVERLQSDLRIYSNRLVKQASPEPVQEEIEATESEVAVLTADLAEANAKKDSVQVRIEKLSEEIARQEARIASEGGGYAKKREVLKLQQQQCQTEVEKLEDEIREMCNGLFPFSLVPNRLKRLRARLIKEMELEEWEAKNRALTEQNTAVLDTLESGTFWEGVSLSGEQIADIHAKLAPLLKTQFERPEALRGFTKLRDRAPSERRQLLKWIETCLNEVPQQMRQLFNALEKAQRELQKVEQALQRVPSDELLKPLLEELSVLNQTLGQLQKQEQDVDKSVQSLTRQLAEVERNREKLYHAQQLGREYLQRQKCVSGVQSVLSTYTTRLTETKMLALGDAIVEGFNQLSHKPDRIKRVEIHPRTFAVTLYDTRSQPITKEELSAGEKQIYTTALLWGLAKTSGKALPMILDTPLGRLDSDHRCLLIEQYFPYTSHQVVLLSTDTEVDEHLYTLLKPHISHTFCLAYQQAEACTTVERGYFGKERCD